MNATLDTPDAYCHLHSHGCSRLVSGVGGFDQHHPVPVELGGSPDQPLLTLCPVHHRRQHAGIRYLVERDGAAEWVVRRRFTEAEWTLITQAYAGWVAAGRPEVRGWPCPAARGL